MRGARGRGRGRAPRSSTWSRSLDAYLDLDALTVFARWITPALTPKRFDTWFYAVTAPAEQLAACDGRETVDAEWIAPAEALRLAAEGERKVIFPTRMNLQLLAEASSGTDAAARGRRGRTLVTVQPGPAARRPAACSPFRPTPAMARSKSR